jgi:phage tail sheath protein FI
MAPEYLSPGVYVEEVDRGTKPIESVGTSTLGILGISKKGPRNEATLITNWSQYTRTFGEFGDSQYLSHAVYGFFLNGGTRCFVVNVAPEDGDLDNPRETDSWFIGSDNGPGTRTGLMALEEVDEVAVVCAPGQTSPAVQEAVLSHCERLKDRFAILDSPEVIDRGGVDRLPKPRDSKYGAYYFPWLQVYDPVKKENVYVPPSGHMSGIYSRSDGERGVHKAPANEIVRGALGLKYSITKGEHDILNPKGINVIRDFSKRGRGIRVWGARTLSSDPSWRYVNVRRLFIMVEESIDIGTQWVVFEPNDEKLWKRIERNITAYLRRVWLDGALFGRTPEEAFYVKCDAETNPPEVRDVGQCIIEIGMAPVKPAEFVIFRIGQWQGGSETSE